MATIGSLYLFLFRSEIILKLYIVTQNLVNIWLIFVHIFRHSNYWSMLSWIIFLHQFIHEIIGTEFKILIYFGEILYTQIFTSLKYLPTLGAYSIFKWYSALEPCIEKTNCLKIFIPIFGWILLPNDALIKLQFPYDGKFIFSFRQKVTEYFQV